ncbi:MAG: TrbG/VirB9 family P-type conjugative transfer protein, partial [bacterium]|nr:TrbG/VirB9 family P-type conjugative transfer protein [bacterium]
MKSKLLWSLCLATWCLAQTPRVAPRVVALPVRDGHVAVLHLAPRDTSTVRMPEPVNSVAVGDPALFSAEHSEREPRLVFVKPITSKPARSNLLITTTRGDQSSLLLVSRGEANGEGPSPVDFVLRYRRPGRFLIEPTGAPSAIVPQTVSVPAANTALPDPAGTPMKAKEHSTLDALLARQRK